MARAEMTTLITTVRSLIGDNAGTAQVWTDDQIQTYLDDSRVYISLYPIFFDENTVPAGSLSYLTGQVMINGVVPGGTASVGGTVEDSRGSIVLGWNMSTDGRIVFDNSQFGSARFYKGYQYDQFDAAASILEAWAALTADCVDTFVENNRFYLSKAGDRRLALADRYYAKALPKYGQLIRDDTLPQGQRLDRGLSNTYDISHRRTW